MTRRHVETPREIDHLGYVMTPQTQQIPRATGDKNNDGKHNKNSRRRRKGTRKMDPNMNPLDQDTTPRAAHPGQARRSSESAQSRLKSFGQATLDVTAEHVAEPLAHGFFAGAGALLAYWCGKKIGIV